MFYSFNYSNPTLFMASSKVITLEELACKTDNFKEEMEELAKILRVELGGSAVRTMFEKYQCCLSPKEYADVDWWVQVDSSFILSEGYPPPWIKNRHQRFSLP